MSLSKPLAKLIFLLITSFGMIVLAGCTFAPVYSGKLAEQRQIELTYAQPGNRLAQIINQELALRLGSSTSPSSPLVTIVANSAVRSTMLSATLNPYKAYETTVTATLTIVARDGSNTAPLSFTRTATAGFSSDAQVMADTEAQIDASERAARSVAESLRLAVLASLAR